MEVVELEVGCALLGPSLLFSDEVDGPPSLPFPALPVSPTCNFTLFESCWLAPGVVIAEEGALSGAPAAASSASAGLLVVMTCGCAVYHTTQT